MLKIVLNSDIDQLKDYIDEHLFLSIKNRQVNRFECHDNVNLLSFDFYDIKSKSAKPSQIIIYFSCEHLFFVCSGVHCLNHVKKITKEESTNVRTLYAFFAELIKTDPDTLQDLEEHITETEDSMLETSKKESTQVIIILRRELLRLKKYYEQLNQIFEGLTENENELISPEYLRYFRILDSKNDRIFAHVLNLRDYVTQVREAYQAQVDIEQNKLMKVFTVITSIFMPLTLLVGWYGMNLQMPEFKWEYSYPLVIILSISIATFCIIYFKRKKWFGK